MCYDLIGEESLVTEVYLGVCCVILHLTGTPQLYTHREHLVRYFRPINIAPVGIIFVR